MASNREKGASGPDLDGVAIGNIMDNSGALRKNKAFQQLRREMEQRNRQRRKVEEERVEVYYVDRDRAAAVVLGNKDIKNDLRHKKKRDRMENSQAAAAMNEEVDFETYLLQGQHELRGGDPRRAVMYLTQACEAAPNGQDEPFMLRSKCFCLLGMYEMADRDADVILKINPHNVKGLTNKAEMQYNLGNFEHSLKYFYRANSIRPGYNNVVQGIQKSREAIENSLSRSKGFSFAQMEDAIKEIERQEMSEEEKRQNQQLRRMGLMKYQSFMDGDSTDEEASEEDHDDQESVDSLMEEEIKAKEKEESCQISNPLLLEVPPELEGVWDPQRDCARPESRQDERQVGHSPDNSLLKHQKSLKRSEHLEKKANKQVQTCAHEALAYLQARKDFWQQQKPVYARDNENRVKRRSVKKKL